MWRFDLVLIRLFPNQTNTIKNLVNSKPMKPRKKHRDIRRFEILRLQLQKYVITSTYPWYLQYNISARNTDLYSDTVYAWWHNIAGNNCLNRHFLVSNLIFRNENNIPVPTYTIYFLIHITDTQHKTYGFFTLYN